MKIVAFTPADPFDPSWIWVALSRMIWSVRTNNLGQQVVGMYGDGSGHIVFIITEPDPTLVVPGGRDMFDLMTR